MTNEEWIRRLGEDCAKVRNLHLWGLKRKFPLLDDEMIEDCLSHSYMAICNKRLEGYNLYQRPYDKAIMTAAVYNGAIWKISNETAVKSYKDKVHIDRAVIEQITEEDDGVETTRNLILKRLNTVLSEKFGQYLSDLYCLYMSMKSSKKGTQKRKFIQECPHNGISQQWIEGEFTKIRKYLNNNTHLRNYVISE